MPHTYCLSDDVAGEGGEYDGTEKRNEQGREGRWIFMDEGSCSHLTYNARWRFCMIYSSCVVKLSYNSAFKAAALFVVVCHPLTSVSTVSSASPPPPCLSVCPCVCLSLREGTFSEGDITSTKITHPGSYLPVAHSYEYESEWPASTTTSRLLRRGAS